MEKHFLHSFFNPTSIAVIGASKNALSLNYNLFGNLVRLGFGGTIYPVNPKADVIQGKRAVANIKDIPGEIDMVVTAVPASATLEVIKDCVAKKVKRIVLVSGGFSEIGEQGIKMQEEIASLIKENGIRLLGPNTLSPINTANNLVISFYPVEHMQKGNVSLVFQSGMYDLRLSWLFDNFRLGVNKILDLGNKMDITEVDALEYLAQDEDTRVIGIHLETIRGNPKKFMQVLKETSGKKPIVVLKTGRTSAGAKAAASHTGSIIRGSDIVFDNMLQQAGVIRAQNLDEFFDFLKVLSYQKPPNGKRCAIASISGGEGVMAADLCYQEGFELAKPDEKTIDRIRTIFPPWEIPVNPIDIGVCTQFHLPGEPYGVFFEAMSTDQFVDCLFVQLPNVGYLFPDISKFPAELFCSPFLKASEKGKTTVTWAVNATSATDPLVIWLELHGVPVYPSASRAIKALKVIAVYETRRRT